MKGIYATMQERRTNPILNSQATSIQNRIESNEGQKTERRVHCTVRSASSTFNSSHLISNLISSRLTPFAQWALDLSTFRHCRLSWLVAKAENSVWIAAASGMSAAACGAHAAQPSPLDTSRHTVRSVRSELNVISAVSFSMWGMLT